MQTWVKKGLTPFMLTSATFLSFACDKADKVRSPQLSEEIKEANQQNDENAPVPAMGVSSILPNFASIDTNILQVKCAICHSGLTPALNIDLSSYEKIMNSTAFPPLIIPLFPEKSSLYKVIVSGKMPVEQNKLSPHEIETVRAWIEKGARKNESDPIPLPNPEPTEPED